MTAPLDAAPLSCWVCDSVDTVPWRSSSTQQDLRPDDLRITDARYGTTLPLRRCRACGFLFAPSARAIDLTQLYAALADPDYDEGADSRALQMRGVLQRLRRQRPAARTLLDVGAASGILVREASRAGFAAEGVEPSAALVESARRAGALVHAGSLPHPALTGRRFDVVTLVDVLEHVTDPLELLRQAAAALAPGGCVIIVTPDLGSAMARLLGARWWHFRLAHVGYFDDRSLTRALRASGLRPLSKGRACWYFPIGYLATRLERYLPLGRVNAALGRSSAGRSLFERVVPLNLHDSFAWLAEAGT